MEKKICRKRRIHGALTPTPTVAPTPAEEKQQK